MVKVIYGSFWFVVRIYLVLQLETECPDLKLHFIGHLQRNKINKLLSVVNKIFVVETVDSELLAKSLHEAMERKNLEEKLRIMIQVNTSGEECKECSLIFALCFKKGNY